MTVTTNANNPLLRSISRTFVKFSPLFYFKTRTKSYFKIPLFYHISRTRHSYPFFSSSRFLLISRTPVHPYFLYFEENFVRGHCLKLTPFSAILVTVMRSLSHIEWPHRDAFKVNITKMVPLFGNSFQLWSTLLWTFHYQNGVLSLLYERYREVILLNTCQHWGKISIE